MTHLRIELNNIQENVSGAVIEKLYELVHNNTLDNTSNLSGNIHTTGTYLYYVDLLNQEYPELTINADNYFSYFVDPEVSRVMIATYGNNGLLFDSDLAQVTTINANLFKNNTTIATFDELSRYRSITTIGNSAFEGCTNLESILLNNVTSINNFSFKGCTSLTNITVSSNTTFVGNNAFEGCSNLETVTGLSNATHIYQYAFSGCTKLTTDIDFTKLIVIGRGAFFNNLLLTGVLNLSYLTTLGSSAFNSTNITGISSLGSITTIELDCFSGCSNLTGTIDLSGITTMQDRVFRGTAITSVINTNSLNGKFGALTFENCASLTSITLPNNVGLELGQNCFNGCSSLTSLTIPSNTSFFVSGLSELRECNLGTMANITSIQINSTNFEYLSMEGNMPHLDFTLPSHVTRINLRNLVVNSFTFPLNNQVLWILPTGNSVKSQLTYDWDNFTKATGESLIWDVTGPSGGTFTNFPAVKVIPGYIFSGKNPASMGISITSIIANAVVIGRYAFRQMNGVLGDITIPASIKYIGLDAFAWNGNNISSITILATTPPELWTDSSGTPTAFNYNYGNTMYSGIRKIYVPAASVNTYKTAWPVYTDMIEAIPSS